MEKMGLMWNDTVGALFQNITTFMKDSTLVSVSQPPLFKAIASNKKVKLRRI